jgi:hypothetical protein
LLLMSSGLVNVLQAYHWSANPGIGFASLSATLDALAENAGPSTYSPQLEPAASASAQHSRQASGSDVGVSLNALVDFVTQLQVALHACVEQALLSASRPTTNTAAAAAAAESSMASSSPLKLPPLSAQAAQPSPSLSLRTESATPATRVSSAPSGVFVLHYESSSSMREEREEEEEGR